MDRLSVEYLLPHRDELDARAAWLLRCLPLISLPDPNEWVPFASVEITGLGTMEGKRGLMLAMSWDPTQLPRFLLDQVVLQNFEASAQKYHQLRHITPFEHFAIRPDPEHPLQVLRAPGDFIVVSLRRSEFGYTPVELAWYKRRGKDESRPPHT